MRSRLSLSLAAVLCFVELLHAADVSPADQERLHIALALKCNPSIPRAVASENYATRQLASQQLQIAFAQQALALASSKVPEVQARLLGVLEFNDGLIRWIEDFLKLPKEERDAQFQFVSQPNVLPVLSKIFSSGSNRRVEGVKELGKLDLPGADTLLARLIDDEDRATSLAAMEVAWDRKITSPLVDALWRRAIDATMTRNSQYAAPRAPLTFRGRAIPGSSIAAFMPFGRTTDSDIATEVLIHFQSPEINAKLIAFFKSAAEVVGRPDVTNQQLYPYSAYYASAKNAYSLVQSYKPPEIIPFLFPLATCRDVQKMPISDKAKKYFTSNRTVAIATFVVMTNQRPEDYGLTQLDRNTGGMVWVSSTEADEDLSVAKLQRWWSQNAKVYGATPPPQAQE